MVCPKTYILEMSKDDYLSTEEVTTIGIINLNNYHI